MLYISLLLLAIYYCYVVSETGGTKYYGSLIKTKKDLFFALIPFQLWVKYFVREYKELNK